MTQTPDILKKFIKKDLIHFSAIGGISMSAIAEFLLVNGYRVQGSDLSENKNIKHLKKKYGIKVFIGQEFGNVTKADLIVRSSAIMDNNPEIVEAKKLGIPIVHRSDMLAKIMEGKDGVCIAGSNGKTSTTAITAIMLEIGNEDPTVINGGIINYYNDNAKVGKGKHIVVETDESDGTFLKYPSKIKIITSIEPEHLDFFQTFENEKKYFYEFITDIPEKGLTVLCTDDECIKEIYKERKEKQNITTYGLSGNPDVSAQNIKQTKAGLTFDIIFNKENKIIKNVFLSAYGTHYVQNALAAVAVAKYLNFSDEIIKKGLAGYTGVEKRFTKVGEFNGISIIDDYAHNPSKIKAAIKGGRTLLENSEKLIVVFEPHRFTRVRDLMDGFAKSFDGADVLIVSDIYSANQEPIEGITQDTLIEAIKKNRQKKLYKAKEPKELPDIIYKIAKTGDLVLYVGAGNSTNWARSLESQLKMIENL
jgi:UDP-N-acetylmuramate--alanine ligase